MPWAVGAAGSGDLVDDLEVTEPVGGGVVTLSFVPAVVLLQPVTAAAPAIDTVTTAAVTV